VNRLSQLRRDQLDPTGQQVWDTITADDAGRVGESGALGGPFNAFVHAPDVGRRLISLGVTVLTATSLDRRLTEVAVITVGARWRAEFEWWAHARIARKQGVDPAVVTAIGAGEDPPFEREDERVVYEAAHELASSGQLGRDRYDAVCALLGEAGTVEFVALCGYYTLLAFMLNAFAVPLPPGVPHQWPADAD
jgi:4-carboxymuconolactone decarboxylase